jgi:hypothetical protein
MTRAKKRKRQQNYDAAKLLEAIAKTATTAVEIYKTVKPIIRATRTVRWKIK